jgi:hypothetical protein
MWKESWEIEFPYRALENRISATLKNRIWIKKDQIIENFIGYDSPNYYVCVIVIPKRRRENMFLLISIAFLQDLARFTLVQYK